MDNVETVKMLETLLKTFEKDIEFNNKLQKIIEERGIDVSNFANTIALQEDTNKKIELLTMMIEILKK